VLGRGSESYQLERPRVTVLIFFSAGEQLHKGGGGDAGFAFNAGSPNCAVAVPLLSRGHSACC
jgi:hypothetical protein